MTFSPATAAVRDATATVTYHNGVTAGQTTARTTGYRGVAPANITDTFRRRDLQLRHDSKWRLGGSHFHCEIGITGAVAATSVAGSGLASPFIFKGSLTFLTSRYRRHSARPRSTRATPCTIAITTPAGTGTHNDTRSTSVTTTALTTNFFVLSQVLLWPYTLTISDGPWIQITAQLSRQRLQQKLSRGYKYGGRLQLRLSAVAVSRHRSL